MRTITNTILSIAALAMILSFALVTPSMAAGWNHMHDGYGWSMMHNTNGYGPQQGMWGSNHMGGGMMYGGHMMTGGHMYDNTYMHNGNAQGVMPCGFTFAPQGAVPAPTPGQ